MKRFGLILCFLWLLAGLAFGADRRLAFELNNAVHLANLDGTIVRNVTNGTFPAISPDGRTIVFTSFENADQNGIRRLATVDVATTARHIFDKIPGDNAYAGAWSPDGNWIAFTLHADGLWSLAMIKSDGTGFRFVKKGVQNKLALYSPSWARDGQSLFCQDMTNIYRLSLEGAVINQWRIDDIIPGGAMSTEDRIDVSPDGHRLLLSVEMDEEYNRKNWDGPVPALWSFDLNTEATVRLTSKNLFAWGSCWLDDENLLFVSQGPNDANAALYRTNGKTLKRLIEGAKRPTVSALAPR